MNVILRVASAAAIVAVLAHYGWSQASETPGGLVARDWFWTSNEPAENVGGAGQTRPANPAVPETPNDTDAAVRERSTPPDSASAPTFGGRSRPLAIRYSVRQLIGGWYEEVDPASSFSTGDRIKITVEVNDAAELYVVTRAASGEWRALFPTDEIEDGSNHVEAYRQYDVPPGDYNWVFAPPPGPETVFIIASRQPVRELDELLYRGQAVAEGDRGPLAGDSPIPDTVIAQVQTQMRTRDLVLDKVENMESDRHATYVADVTAEGEGYVVAELNLQHRGAGPASASLPGGR